MTELFMQEGRKQHARRRDDPKIDSNVTEELKAPVVRRHGAVAMTSGSAIWWSQAFHHHSIFPKGQAAYLRDFHRDL